MSILSCSHPIRERSADTQCATAKSSGDDERWRINLDDITIRASAVEAEPRHPDRPRRSRMDLWYVAWLVRLDRMLMRQIVSYLRRLIIPTVTTLLQGLMFDVSLSEIQQLPPSADRQHRWKATTRSSSPMVKPPRARHSHSPVRPPTQE